MANNMDANLEFLAGQVADLELEKEELLRKSEEADRLIAQAQKDASDKQKLLDEAARLKAEMEKQAKELEQRYNAVYSQLEAAKKAEDYKYNKEAYRLAQKQKEHLQKEVQLARAEVKQTQAKSEVEKAALSKQVEDARAEVERSEIERRELLGKFDVYTHVFNNIIFPKFAERFAVLSGETANDINGVKLRRAVDTSKKFDKDYDKAKTKYEAAKAKNKQVVAPQKSSRAYSTIMAEILEDYNDFLTEFSKTPEGKQLVDQYRSKLAQKTGTKGQLATPEQEVEQILADQSKAAVKEFFLKTGIGRTLIAAGAVAIAAAITVGSLFGTGYFGEKTDKQLAEIDGVVQSSVSVIEENYDSILEADTNAERLSGIFNAGGQEVAVRFAAQRDKEVDRTGMEAGHAKVQEAKSNAEDFIKYDANGNVAGDCHYQMLVNEFNDAVSNKDINRARETSELISEVKEQVVSYKADASNGYSEMLEHAGISMSEINDIVNILNAPTSTVEFDAGTVKQYKDVLIDQGRGGTAVSIISNEYVKNTGDVTLLVECKDAWRTEYYNLIEFQTDRNVNVMSGEQMMGALQSLQRENPGAVKSTSFDKDLVSGAEGQSSEMSTVTGDTVTGSTAVKYTLSDSYDKASNSTKVTATALVTVTNEEGKVVGIDTIEVSQIYKGAVTASSVEASMKAELAKKVGNQLNITVNLEAEDASELQ